MMQQRTGRLFSRWRFIIACRDRPCPGSVGRKALSAPSLLSSLLEGLPMVMVVLYYARHIFFAHLGYTPASMAQYSLYGVQYNPRSNLLGSPSLVVEIPAADAQHVKVLSR